MSIENIKKLRERTGAGMLDIKKALNATNNNIEASIEWLRTNGIVKAAKKSGRIAAEGSIFLVKNNKKTTMIEINTETDFVVLNNLFVEESNKIANAILNSNITNGDINEALALKYDGKSIESILTNMTAIIGEKISLRRFVSFDGLTGAYKHTNNRIGVIISGESIDEIVLRDVAMHIAAMNPEFLIKDEISEEIIIKETKLVKIELADVLNGKPKNIQENIIQGKVNKILLEGVLTEQTFVKDSSKKIKDLLGSGSFNSFVRYEVGEGIEKKEENFAEEVAKQIKK